MLFQPYLSLIGTSENGILVSKCRSVTLLLTNYCSIGEILCDNKIVEAISLGSELAKPMHASRHGNKLSNKLRVACPTPAGGF